MKRICRRCGTEVIEETDMKLKQEYPYYCPICDENMFAFETEVFLSEDDEKEELIRKIENFDTSKYDDVAALGDHSGL